MDKALKEDDPNDSTPYSPRSPSYSPPGSPGPSNHDVICLSDEEEEPNTAERYVLFFSSLHNLLLILFCILLSRYCVFHK